MYSQAEGATLLKAATTATTYKTPLTGASVQVA
jgi:hypothetical protein